MGITGLKILYFKGFGIVGLTLFSILVLYAVRYLCLVSQDDESVLTSWEICRPLSNISLYQGCGAGSSNIFKGSELCSEKPRYDKLC